MADVRWEGSKRGLPIPQNLELSRDASSEPWNSYPAHAFPPPQGSLRGSEGSAGLLERKFLHSRPSHLPSPEVVSRPTPETYREKNLILEPVLCSPGRPRDPSVQGPETGLTNGFRPLPSFQPFRESAKNRDPIVVSKGLEMLRVEEIPRKLPS